jgi:hypothetical protein
MLLIGFGHRARQGKSYAARIISEVAGALGLEARIYSVGDEVQRWCAQRGMIPHNKPREALTVHELSLLGHYGWALRQENEDVWISRVLGRIREDAPDVALIPNVRYPNEARRMTEREGVNVLVERFNADGSRFIAPDRDPNIASETSLDFWNWDYRLTAGSGQLDWLTAQAKALFSVLLDANKNVLVGGLPCQVCDTKNLLP